MGQSPSTAKLPPEWKALLPNIKRDDIIRSAKRVRISEDRTIYLDDEEFDLDDQVPVALAILRDFPHIKDVRFKLVPGRLTEEQFWGGLFGYLQETVEADRVIETVVGKLDNMDVAELQIETKISQSSVDDEPAAAARSQSEANDDNYNGSDSSSQDNIPPFYLEEFKAQEEYIHRLQRSLREANQKIRKLGLELHKERKKRHSEGVEREGETENGGTNTTSNTLQHRDSIGSCQRCNSMTSPPQRLHKGEWILHDDCREFLKLDDHLKENLRKEKEKRINEVLSQMKFILDTDDLKDSYGKWSCCESEDYSADGCT